MNYKRLFYNWLRKENIHKEFFFNAITYNHITHKFNSGKKVFEHVINIFRRDPQTYVCAFIWDDTYQGYHFWLMKSLKWNEYLDQWKRTH